MFFAVAKFALNFKITQGSRLRFCIFVFNIRKKIFAVAKFALNFKIKQGSGLRFCIFVFNAMDARYFAVAHDVSKTFAFTFDALWWEVLPGNDKMKEDVSQCLCEVNSFTDGYVLKATNDGMVMCGCLDNSCWKNP